MSMTQDSKNQGISQRYLDDIRVNCDDKLRLINKYLRNCSFS